MQQNEGNDVAASANPRHHVTVGAERAEEGRAEEGRAEGGASVAA